jgi:hypothetical protein
VDAEVRAFLGGQASPDTREILSSGENPLAKKFAGSADSADAAMTMTMTMGDDEPGPRRRAANPLARPVQLDGLAQMVGLAIGAPEFQRR